MIRLKVLGAGREVGRSGFLLNYKDSNIILDYGLKIEHEGLEYPADPGVKVNSIALSHAHLDHSGMIPGLYRGKQSPWVYATAPTMDLSEILWNDTIKIAEHDGEEPSYTKDQIKEAQRKTQILSYMQEAKIAPDIVIKMYDAGHILGSALTKVTCGDKHVLYTGDYKVEETRLHQGADMDIDEVDYMIVESTYGDRDHPPREKVEKDFIKNVRDILTDGGSVMLPSFAIGRAQELAYILHEHKVNDVPIYFDGMSQAAANIYMKYPGYYKNPYDLREAFGKTTWVRNQKQRKKATQQQCIIITTAGMLEGGPILYYLRKMYNNERNAVFMTGFQVEGTKGSNLLKTGNIEIEGELYETKVQIRNFDFSAHIGQSYLLKSISKWNPQKIVCVHGNDKIVSTFTETIKDKLGINAIGPKNGDTIKFE